MEASIPPAEAPSLGELRERHLALLREWNQSADQPPAERAEQLRAAAQALGAWLDDLDERDRAQAIIDYWAAALTGASGRSMPELVQLAPFDPSLPQVLLGRAEAIVAPHVGTALEDDIETMLQRLVRPGPGDTIICRSPVERSDLLAANPKPEAAAQLGAVLDKFVDARIIRRVTGDGPGDDKFEFMFGSVARAWPRLHELLKARRSSNETRDKLLGVAQQWDKAGRDSGYLLAGDALDEAGKYLGEDPLLDEFIRASRHALIFWRWVRLIGTLALLAVAVIVVWQVYGVALRSGLKEGESKGLEAGATLESEAPSAYRLTDEGTPGVPPPQFIPDIGVSGFLWAGPTRPLLFADPESGEPIDPAAIRAGKTLRLRTDRVVRAERPTPERDGGQLGIVREDRLVRIESIANVSRGGTSRRWFAVRLLPQVKVNYSHADSALADMLVRRLREGGFDAFRGNHQPDEETSRQVIYFRKEYGTIAAGLTRQVNDALRPTGDAPAAVTCRFTNNSDYEPGYFEVWVDFSGIAVTRHGAVSRTPPPACDEGRG